MTLFVGHQTPNQAILRALMGIRRMLAVLVGLSLFLAPQAAHGEAICSPKDPKSCVQAVMAGEEVPFSGQLLTHRRAARLVAAYERCEDLRAADLEEAHQLHQIQLDFLYAQRDLRAWEHEQTILLLREQIKNASAAWYEHPAIVAGGSALLTALLFVGAVEVLKCVR